MNNTAAPSAVGIIAEYNPFHNGHAYHIRQAKELSGADFAVVVMSGDFVQRGEPAIFHKYTRARMALSCGADLVFEIPSVFAASSAEDFAFCSVSLLHQLGVVDFLCFGSESGELTPLASAASLLIKEPADYSNRLKTHLKAGFSFPKARAMALSEQLPGISPDIWASPNNILGIEYLKALLRLESPIKPLTISRKGEGYHSTDLENPMASASAIRLAYESMPLASLPRESGFEDSLLFSRIQPHIPEKLIPLYRESRPLMPEDFSALLDQALLNSFQDLSCPLTDHVDWTPEMAARMKSQLLSWGTWEERVKQLKVKNITYTRASRALLHLLLGHRKEEFQAFQQNGCAPYARLLGFRRSAAPLLTALKANSQIPLITKTANAQSILPPDAYQLFCSDLYSSHLYQSVYYQRYRQRLKNEFTHPIVLL